MKLIDRWIQKYQVASFFVLVFFLVFCIGIPGIYLSSGDNPAHQVLQFCLVQLWLFSPALAGVLISVRLGQPHSDYNPSRRWRVFFLSWLVACSVASLYAWQVRPRFTELSLAVLAIGLGALLPAFIISAAFARSSGLRSYLSTLVRPKGRPVWYLVALFTFPLVHLLGNMITGALAGDITQTIGSFDAKLTIVVASTFLSVLFFSGGINEESGWRGFAIPRLQSRYSPLVACLVVWLFHVVWELPGDTIFSNASWPMMSRLVWMPAWSVLFVWVYNRTDGSILAPVLFHASMNSMNPLMGVLPATAAGTTLLVALAFFALIKDKMWLKLPSESGAVFSGLGPV